MTTSSEKNITSSKELSTGCTGCLGTLVLLTALGSLFFGGGIFLRVGNFGWGFGNPIDRQQVIADYWTELYDNQVIVQKAVDNFRMQWKSGKCEEIYNQASDELKNTTQKSAFIDLCSTILPQNLGDLQSTQNLGWFVQTDGTSNYIFVRYSTKFSKLVTQEHFIWRVKQDKVELINYQIFPSLPNDFMPTDKTKKTES